MSFEKMVIGGNEYMIRFPGLVQIDIAKNAGKTLFDQPQRRFSLSDLVRMLADPEVQAYLLWKGIQGGMPGLRNMKFETAIELRDQFLESGDLDAGEKYEEFTTILAMAVAAANGSDGKKLAAKAEEAAKKAEEEAKARKTEELKVIYKAKMLAEQEIAQEQKAAQEQKTAGTGTEQPNSA